MGGAIRLWGWTVILALVALGLLFLLHGQAALGLALWGSGGACWLGVRYLARAFGP